MTERHVLPINSKDLRVTPRTPTRLAGKPQRGAFMIERIFVSAAGTPNGAADWVVNDIEIDGVGQLATKDLPAALFASGNGVVARKRGSGQLHFNGLVVEKDVEVALVVSYVGPNPEGVPFYASMIGGRPPQRPRVLPIATRGLVREATITVRLDAPIKIERLVIESGREAVDWVVDDVRVDGETQFAQSGPMPGDMFALGSIDSFVRWTEGRVIELDVKYIGFADPNGERFIARIESRSENDESIRPPDIRAIVTCGTEEEEVVARCDWRPPYVAEEAGR